MGSADITMVMDGGLVTAISGLTETDVHCIGVCFWTLSSVVEA